MRPEISSKAISQSSLYKNVGATRSALALKLLLMLVAIMGVQSAYADQVFMTATMTVSADSALDGTFADTVGIPLIVEDIAGEWDDTTQIFISAPLHYEFDTASMVTAMPTGTLDLGAGPGAAVDAVPTANLVMFTVNGAHLPPAAVTFTGIRLRAADLAGAAPGLVDIMVQVDTPGNANVLETPAPLINVTVEPGAPVDLEIGIITSPQISGVPFDVPLCVLDQFGNTTTATADTAVRVFVFDGSGGLSGDRDGTIMNGSSCTVAGDVNVAYGLIEANITLAAYVISGNALTPAFSNAFDVDLNVNDVDLRAVALTYDSITQAATLSYAVDGPVPVAPYDIEFFLDLDGNGLFDPVLDGPAITSVAGMINPGSYSAPGDFTSNPPDAGQYVFAAIDLAGAVAESDASNNDAGALNTALLDVAAAAATYDPVTREATLGYNVLAPIPVDAYVIAFFLDRDLSGDFDAVFDGPAVDIVGGDVNPGAHSALGNFNAEPAAANQLIFAIVDFAGQLTENDETNNNSSAMNTALVDLEAVLLTYDSILTNARLGYHVTAPTALPAYDIEFYLDRDLSGDLDVVLDAPPVATIAGDVNPGSYTIDADFSGAPAGASQLIFAVIDRLDAVLEDDEGNNNAQVQNSAVIDLQAVSLAYDSVTRNATLGYTVATPTVVAPYDIEFFLDRNGDDLFTFMDDGPAVISVAGEVNPGAYVYNGDLSSDPPAADQRIFAIIDRSDAVVEFNEGNNQREAVNSALVDIALNSVSLTADNTVAEVTVSYTVVAPTPVNPYIIRIGLDTDGIPATIEHVLAEPAGDSAIGAHSLTVDVRAALDAIGVEDGYNIVAVVDAGLAVAEDDETNNTDDAAISVDLRVEGVVLLNEFPFRAQIVYTILSPARVPDFDILLGKDAPANVLLTRPATVAERNPGTHSVEANIATALRNAGVVANENVVIAARIDANLAVTESDEGNNMPNPPAGAVSAFYRVDLRMDQLIFPGTDVDVDFSIDVGFSVASNPPTENFTISIYASENDALVVTAGDVLLRQFTITNAAEKTVGAHQRSVNHLQVSAADFNTGEFFLKAVIDVENNVVERTANGLTAENNNVRAAQNVNPSGANIDRDGDGLSVREEAAGFSLDGVWRADQDEPGRISAKQTVTSDDFADSDDDGLSDALERATGTNPNDPDTDADGLTDDVEDENRNGVVDAGETNPRLWDTDGDGLSDNEETLGFTITVYTAGSDTGRFNHASVETAYSDPLLADTDGDGISDWNEVNTWAREATAAAMESAGLRNITARNLLPVNKPVAGIRTDPSNPDTDGDGLRDDVDPAPQLNPARWGYDMNNDGVFNTADLNAIRAAAEAADEDTTDFPTNVTTFQRRLLDFDQDGDGFLEAPDANGDGFPDFTRYNESTLEQAFGIDFSNNGSLADGFDVGGLGRGPQETPDPRPGSVSSGVTRFGTFRVIRAANGEILGDGVIDEVDSIGQLIPTDNCPNSANADQRDFDGDGLGDECDADRDNDGVPNNLDPVDQEPGSAQAIPGLCGFGAFQSMLLTLLGLAGWRRFGGYAGRRE